MSQDQEFVQLVLDDVEKNQPYSVARLLLNRPQSANAFDDTMIRNIISAIKDVQQDSRIRALVISGLGKHFSAGADLGWMKRSMSLTFQQNLDDAGSLIEMFESIDELDIPVVTVVHGSAFGGAVGLAAVSDIVVAEETAKFCLSEVKLGLLPAVILPYLARRMTSGALKRSMLTARIISARDALDAGLCDLVVKNNELDQAVAHELNQILSNGPLAIARLKRLYRKLRADHFAQNDITGFNIAEARSGEEGQAGLSAFFAKSSPPWVSKLPEQWKLKNG